jgi:hypothetical protein
LVRQRLNKTDTNSEVLRIRIPLRRLPAAYRAFHALQGIGVVLNNPEAQEGHRAAVDGHRTAPILLLFAILTAFISGQLTRRMGVG